MVLALHTHVIGGVEAEDEQLLSEGDGADKLHDVVVGLGPELVEEDGADGVDEEGEGDGGVLEVLEVVRGDCTVGIERLVAVGADEEFHGHRGSAANHDQVELKVPQDGGGEPRERVVFVVEKVEFDVIVKMPETNQKEGKAWCDMPN
ncbi:hypothetical protein Ancab_000038 [Ancistrocladus abbreviatus]